MTQHKHTNGILKSKTTKRTSDGDRTSCLKQDKLIIILLSLTIQIKLRALKTQNRKQKTKMSKLIK